MTLLYNIQVEKADIIIKQGDTFNMSFRVYLNNGSNPAYPKNDPFYYYDITGMQVDVQFRRKDGMMVKDYSSGGGTPVITILTSTFNIYDNAGFADIDTLDYDVQITDGVDRYTFGEGEAFIKKQITK